MSKEKGEVFWLNPMSVLSEAWNTVCPSHGRIEENIFRHVNQPLIPHLEIFLAHMNVFPVKSNNFKLVLRDTSDTKERWLSQTRVIFHKNIVVFAITEYLQAHSVDNPVLVATPLRNPQELASPTQEHEKLPRSGLGAVPVTPIVRPADTPSTVTSTATHTQRSSKPHG